MTEDLFPERYCRMSRQELMRHFGRTASAVDYLAKKKGWQTLMWIGRQRIFRVPVSDLADPGDGRRRGSSGPGPGTVTAMPLMT